MRRLFFVLFFLSGFSALVYEVVWARQLVLVFGNTVYAVSTILTIFFAGLALGSWFFGRVADKIALSVERLASRKGRDTENSTLYAKRYTLTPLMLYGFLELGIGIYAGATPLIFRVLGGFQVLWGQGPGLVFLGLILPTFLMGGTFPAISRFLAADQRENSKMMSNLYSLNTLGGVLGVLLAGFVLIRELGVRETIWLAAAINLGIGVVALGMRVKGLGFRKEETVTDWPKEPSPLMPLFLAVFLSGFASLALEVLWTRVLILVMGSSTYAFTIILAVFLLGIAFGSFLASKFLLEKQNLISCFVFLEMILGGGVILINPFLEKLPFLFLDFYKKSSGFTNNLWASFVLSFLVILPLTVLMGILFPIAIKILVREKAVLGSDLGKVYGLNTLGGILGALAAGFIFIPFLGMQKGILLSGAVYLLAGTMVVLCLSDKRRLKVSVSVVSLFLLLISFIFPAWDKQVLSSGVFIYFYDYLSRNNPRQAMASDQLLYYKEGLSATVVVKKDEENVYLRINGKTDASTVGDLETVLLLGHLPLVLHPNPQKVLVIGLGSGITLGAVEQHPIEKVDVVEIEAAIVEAASFFQEANHRALEDKRLRMVVGDGRHFLLRENEKYDVISSEPSNLWVKGNADLFTREYFELARNRLAERGIFLQWVHAQYLDSKSLKTVIATFQSVFPQMTAWSTLSANDLLLLGTKEPLVFDFDAVEKKFHYQPVRQDLDRVSIKGAADIFGLFLFGSDGAKKIAEGEELHIDNRPILEFWTPFALGKETIAENLENLLTSQEEPYSLIEHLDTTKKRKIETSLRLKENIFRGKSSVIRGNFQEGLGYFRKVLSLDPDRPYLKKMIVKTGLRLAEMFYNQNNLFKAKEVLLMVLDLDPLSSKAHLNLGAVYFRQGNIEGAISEWTIAKELDPKSPKAEQNLKLLEKLVQ